MIDASSPPFQCQADPWTPERYRGSFEIYEKGRYITCSFPEPSATLSVTDASICESAFSGNFSVLMYGLLRNSYKNNRELVCDQLSNAGVRVLCVQGVFGKQLEQFVCRASIIVVVHYYENSPLETHRIDPLLLANKIVVSTPSSDPVLDEIYSQHVYFVSPQAIPTVVVRLSNNDLGRNIKRLSNGEFMGDLSSSSLSPLCFALRNLRVDFKKFSQRIGNSG